MIMVILFFTFKNKMSYGPSVVEYFLMVGGGMVMIVVPALIAEGLNYLI